MVSQKKRELPSHPDLWTISKGQYSDRRLQGIVQSTDTAVRPVEYDISGLAEYMLNPFPVEVTKTLVGCEVRYRKPSGKNRTGLRNVVRRMFGKAPAADETFLFDGGPKATHMKDKDLNAYLMQVHALVRREDPMFKKLSTLDAAKVSDVVGTCEDVGGRSALNLQGSTEERINYMRTNVCHDVGVVLQRAEISPGLFDMRGFDFPSFNARNKHVLVRVVQEGKTRCCVLGADSRIWYWVEDAKLVNYMQLLQQSIQTNPDFREAIELCTQDKAQPEKLLFYEQLKIDYSTDHCPAFFKEVFQSCSMSPDERDLVINSLNTSQLGISFNYITRPNNNEEKIVTTLSVMHDLRALEPIRNNLPHLYSQISNRISESGAGNFYLLDSIRGCPNE